MSIARIKKDDTVIVIAGTDKGKTGKVLRVSPKANTVTVEGIHMIKKTVRRTQATPNGGIIEREAPINLSNVMIYDADKKSGARISRVQNGEKTVRQLKTSKKFLD